MRKTAQKILETVRSNFPAAREHERAELRDFPHLDHSFYERVGKEATRLGFEPVCELVDLTANRSQPDPRTVVRVLSRPEDGAVLAVYHFKPTLIWRLLMLLGGYGPERAYEVETELSDGGFVQSTTSGERSKLPAPDSFQRFYFDSKKVSLEDVVRAHSAAVTEYMNAHPGAEPVPQRSFEDVVAAQNRAAAARREHLRSLGWVTREYLVGSTRASEKLADQILEEIRQILAEEEAAEQPVAIPPYGPFPPEPLAGRPDDEPDRPQSFGYGESWLAVRASAPMAVVDALSLEDPLPANWEAGTSAVRAGYTFVSPPVDGWVLVVGRNLPQCGAGDPEDTEWQRLLQRLSRLFNTAHFFYSLRIVGYYAWAAFEDGRERRTFAYLGERGVLLADRGDATEAERQRGYDAFSALPSSEDDEQYLNEELPTPDEQCVMAMAAAWSVDTIALGERTETGSGWIGRLKRGRVASSGEPRSA